MPLSKRLWGGCLFLAVTSAVSAAPPEKAAIDKKKKTPEFVDVTRKVEVQFVEGLRSPDELTHEVFVVLKNTSGGNLPGPLAIVFDEKQKSNPYSFDWYTDTLADGQQYYGLVDVDDSVPVKQASRRRKVYLKTDAPAEVADRGRPEIPFRVIQLHADHVASKQPVDEEVAGKKYSREELDRVKAIQERATTHLLGEHEGISGVFLSEDANGDLNILVQAARRGVAREIPGNFEGIELETEVSGEYRAFDLKPTPDPIPNTAAVAAPTSSSNQPLLAPLEQNRRGRIDRPICIGVSGINITDVCASGTIGCRVKDSAGNLYALSNNHVFSESTGTILGVTIGNAQIGDIINQPSPGDIFLPACDRPATNFLGTLVDWEPFGYVAGATTTAVVQAPRNAIDAAIASVSAQNMGFAAPTDTYGVPSTRHTTASIGLKVQKMGRTTGWTTGVIAGINGTTVVGYSLGAVRFERTILLRRETSGTFGAPGDSGSLVVTEAGNRPVALLFAGSSLGTILCPISVVLDRFNVVVDDGGTTFGGGRSGRLGTAIGPVNRGIRR